MLNKIIDVNRVKRFFIELKRQINNPQLPAGVMRELPSQIAHGYMVVYLSFGYALAKHVKTIITDTSVITEHDHIIQLSNDSCEVLYMIELLTGSSHSYTLWIKEHQICMKNI